MDFLTQYNTYLFERNTTTFFKESNVPTVSGSITTMGGMFILLDARADNVSSRLRLYSDEPSMKLDESRPAGNFNLTESVALIADIVLNDTNLLPLTPPIIGNTFVGGQLWYNLSGSTNPNINVTLTSYPILPVGESVANLDGNTSLVISASNVPTTGNGVSGSITTSKSFLILTGSATSESRLRLYSRPHTEIPFTETTRSFGTASQAGSFLIADLMFDSGSFRYPLVPILEAYTWTNSNYAVGSGQVGYILQNRSASTTNLTASLYIYSTED